jgi:hypothetical protein
MIPLTIGRLELADYDTVEVHDGQETSNEAWFHGIATVEKGPYYGVGYHVDSRGIPDHTAWVFEQINDERGNFATTHNIAPAFSLKQAIEEYGIPAFENQIREQITPRRQIGTAPNHFRVRLRADKIQGPAWKISDYDWGTFTFQIPST